MLTCTAHFKLLPTDESIIFESINLREAITQKFQSLARTAYQRIYEMMTFIQRTDDHQTNTKHAKSNVGIARLFNEKAKLATGTDPVDAAFVGKCKTIYGTFKIKDVADAVKSLEEKCKSKSPFDSVDKLAEMVKKANGREQTAWVFQTIKDLIERGTMTTQDFPTRALIGQGGGGKG